MPMSEYKIVNATQLDADLASIADMIKTKTLETHDYVFPEDFITSINKMSYNENPLGEEDIVVEGKNVIVPEGYYPEMVTNAVNDGMLFANNLILEENPTVAISGDGTSIEVEYSAEKIPEFSLTPGYISTISNDSIVKSQGKTTISLIELFEGRDEATITNNEDGTITITYTLSAVE